MSAIKVLHILHQSLPYHTSGYDIRSHYILKNQIALGITAYAITGPYCYARNDVETIDDVNYYNMSTFKSKLSLFSIHNPFIHKYLGRKLFNHLFITTVDKISKSFKPDIIHAHSPWFTAIPALEYAKKSSIPFIYEVRGLWEESELYEGLISRESEEYRQYQENDAYLVRSADAVTVISESLTNEIIKRVPTAKGKIYVVPNGVDINKFLPKEKDEFIIKLLNIQGKKIIGYFTSLRKLEGIDILLKAMVNISDNTVLIIIGDGPDRKRLESLILNLGISDRVKLLKGVDHKDIQNYYSILDLFIIPRMNAKVCQLVTPLKPLEAMAMGVCVLASNVGGLSELIIDKKTGVLFQAGDSDDLSQKIIQLLNENEFRVNIGKQASFFVREHKSWDKIVSIYDKIYKYLLIK